MWGRNQNYVVPVPIFFQGHIRNFNGNTIVHARIVHAHPNENNGRKRASSSHHRCSCCCRASSTRRRHQTPSARSPAHLRSTVEGFLSTVAVAKWMLKLCRRRPARGSAAPVGAGWVQRHQRGAGERRQPACATSHWRRQLLPSMFVCTAMAKL